MDEVQGSVQSGVEEVQEQLKTPWLRVQDKLHGWVEDFILNLPNYIVALAVFLISYWISRLVKNLVNKYLVKIFKQPSIRNLVATIVAIVVILLGLIISLSVLNLDNTFQAALTGAGVAGLALSLALQGTLANTFSGIFIALQDDINVGDWIDTNEYSGKVISVDLRNTKLIESDNNVVILPNKLIAEKAFKNYTVTSRIRSTINCGVGYESNLREVREIATRAIEKLYPPHLGEKIEFYYTEFGDSSINFVLSFWVEGKEEKNALKVKSEAIIKLKEEFDKHQINIPYPIRTLVSDKPTQEDHLKDTETTPPTE